MGMDEHTSGALFHPDKELIDVPPPPGVDRRKFMRSVLVGSVAVISGVRVAQAAPELLSHQDVPKAHAQNVSNAVIEISRPLFDANIKRLQAFIKNSSGADVCMVMKADAYGHGIRNLLPSVIESGITCIAISSNEEARVVREGKFAGRLMRVRSATAAEVRAAVRYDMQELVGTLAQAEAISEIAQHLDKEIAIHLALNSAGMGRNGLELATERGKAEVLKLVTTPRISVTGIMTHFPNGTNSESLALFKQQANWVIEQGNLSREKITLHVANTELTLGAVDSHLDMVRPGSLFYGDMEPGSDYKRIYSFKTSVASVHHFPKGSAVGYGSTETLQRDSTLANLPIGYSDGYPRSLSRIGEVLIRGQRAKVIGGITMNTTMVDITDIAEVRPGDEVVLLGTQGKDEITIEEIEQSEGALCDLCTIWGRMNARKYIR